MDPRRHIYFVGTTVRELTEAREKSDRETPANKAALDRLNLYGVYHDPVAYYQHLGYDALPHSQEDMALTQKYKDWWVEQKIVVWLVDHGFSPSIKSVQGKLNQLGYSHVQVTEVCPLPPEGEERFWNIN